MSELVERLRRRARDHVATNANGTITPTSALLREAADALERVQRERANLLTLIGDVLQTLHAPHPTDGRLMVAPGRGVAFSAAARALTAAHVLFQTQGEEAALSPQREEPDLNSELDAQWLARDDYGPSDMRAIMRRLIALEARVARQAPSNPLPKAQGEDE